MKRLFAYFKWLWQGKPMKKYTGFNCGCCGAWNDTPFEIPTYQSYGEWYDTWGICPDCYRYGENGSLVGRGEKR